MQNFIIIGVIGFVLNYFTACQASKQIVQYNTGRSNIIFNIIDFDSNEPLIGADILSRDSNQSLAQTDVDGIAVVNNLMLEKYVVEYIGYKPFCFEIIDKSVDSIVIRLKPVQFEFGLVIYNYDYDSLLIAAAKDAENDLLNGEVRVLYNEEPTDEQSEFAQNYNFEFTKMEKPSAYLSVYNGVVLKFLDNKFNIDSKSALNNICW
jgi:hypothetical protein